MTRVYEEIVDFLADGPTSGRVAAWQPSEQARERVVELIEAEKSGSISAEERSELNHYLELEHLMRLVKARAHLRGNGGEKK